MIDNGVTKCTTKDPFKEGLDKYITQHGFYLGCGVAHYPLHSSPWG